MFKGLRKFWHNRSSGKTIKAPKVLINEQSFLLPQNFFEDPQKRQISELWMLDLFKNYLPPGPGTFIDVGVNVGQTLLKLRSVSNMDYLGFEPNPFCVAYLNELITINKLHNVEIIPAGVGSKDRIAQLYSYSDKFDSSATLLKNYRPANPVKQKFYVPVFSMKSIRDAVKIEKVSIIKIDVEGSELEVLKAFRQVIIENKPIILIEILPTYTLTHERNQALKEIVKIIEELNYQIFRISKTSDTITGLQKLKEIEVHDRLDWSDYILKPIVLN